jgi:hypothetical protein
VQAQSIQNARLSLQSSELAPPAPHASDALPPFGSRRGTHPLTVEGAGEPIRTKGQTLQYAIAVKYLLMMSVWQNFSFLLPDLSLWQVRSRETVLFNQSYCSSLVETSGGSPEPVPRGGAGGAAKTTPAATVQSTGSPNPRT